MEENNQNNVVTETPVEQPAQPAPTPEAAPVQPQPQPAPVQPAAPKKSNVGLIIGIGCGVLALLTIIIIIIVVVIIALTGGKKMKCTYKQSTSGCTIYANANLTIKSNKVNKVELDGYADCTGASNEDIMLDAVESSLKKQTNITNIKRSGSKITYDYKESAGLTKVGISKEDAKKKLESAGYKCE